MNVLVTGATGFLGSHVVHALCDRGHRVGAFVRPGRAIEHIERDEVVFEEGDVLDRDSLLRACEGAQGVVHCAARMGYWSRRNAEQRAVNVGGTANLLRAAREAGVERIVHVSSVAAVGATRNGDLLDEQAGWNLAALRLNYADSKREAERLALAEAREGLPVVVVNPSAILGPRLDGLPPSPLITRIADGTMRFTPPGGISVTDVRDVAAAIPLALEGGQIGERYVLAGHNLRWDVLYATIAHVSGGRAPRRKLSRATVRAIAAGASLLDSLRLTRPPWTPELWRSFGWTSWFDSSKAGRELAYEVRPLEVTVRDALAAAAEASR